MNSLLLGTAARLLTGLMLGFSLYMLFRGHNAPGGGFVGWLIAAAAAVLYGFANGAAALRRALRVDPRTVAVAGFGLALLSGMGAALVGAAPFTGLWGDVAGLPVSTVMMFDIGVYLAVFGAMMTLALALEEM